MNETRNILRHFLAALAYRTEKSVRGSPPDFGSFQAGSGTRTPAQVVAHMNRLLRWSRSFFIGGDVSPETSDDLDVEMARFRETVYSLSADMQSQLPLERVTYEQLLQGPLADAMTHAGQLAMLRRLAGDPVEAENFVEADIGTGRASPGPPA